MPMTPRSSSLLGLFLALLTLACGGTHEPEPPPVDEKPLLSLEGQLTVAPGYSVGGPVRLALAWYPGMLEEDAAGEPLSQPGAIVTGGPAYTPTAQSPYRFEVLTPPPAEALRALPSGFQGKGAVGLLLAYADGNGNTRLDTIARQGPPVDQVLGSSLEWTASPAFLIVYVDSAQPAATGLSRGFNLVKLTDAQRHEVVPASTPIPMTLSGGPHLDLFVCEAAWSGSAGEAPCGLDLGSEQPGSLSVDGTFNVHTGILKVELTVSLEGQSVSDAVITLGGEPIGFDAASGRYRAHSLDPVLLTRPEGAELRVSAHGQELRRSLAASGTFQILEPYRVRSDTPFTVRWSASEGAGSYNVSLDEGVRRNLGFAGGLESTEHTFGAITYSGTASLRVEAVRRLDDGRSGQLELKVVRSFPLFFEAAETPPPQGALDVMGTVKLTRYGAETDLAVTRGGEQLTDARVLLGNTELPADPDSGRYTLVEALFGSMFDRGPVELRVLSQGQELRRRLSVPGAFEVLAPALPASPRSGAPLTVSWQASGGAQQYRVMIVAAGPGILGTELTSSLETTLMPPAHEGLATLYVEAVAWVPGGGTGGHIELRRENTVPMRFVP